MKQPLLIADSGGSKTDWCFVNESGERNYFTSESYHPSNWSTIFIERITEFWNQRDQLRQAALQFFCAGCLNQDRANELEAIFRSIGFQKVIVKSDLHAAGLALFGNDSGTFAILGTGSVLVDWNHGNVKHVHGGKGHLIGDEGSGFYFGKLIYESYLNGGLSKEQELILMEKVNLTLLEKKYALGDTKYSFADIAMNLSDNQLEFLDFHIANLEAFYHSVLEKKVPIDLSIVGGYFYHNNSILKPALSKLNVQLVDFQCKPIHALVDYLTGSIE